MENVYWYTQVSGGYRWNMLQRIFNAIGIEPIGSGDVSGQTYLQFSRALTDLERVSVDAIMADNPTFPPVNAGTTYVIRDVWNQKSLFETNLGFSYKIYYSESVPGSGNVDQIELHFGALTNTQKNKVASEYAKLIAVKI
jgi:hypothetical protein